MGQSTATTETNTSYFDHRAPTPTARPGLDASQSRCLRSRELGMRDFTLRRFRSSIISVRERPRAYEHALNVGARFDRSAVLTRTAGL
jgi:hypothetical protein